MLGCRSAVASFPSSDLFAQSDYTPLVNLIGIYFQIRDDLMNLSVNTTYTSNKGFAEDLTEGKFSFPVVHGVRTEKDSEDGRKIISM